MQEYAEVRINAYLDAKASFMSMCDSVSVKRKTEEVD